MHQKKIKIHKAMCFPPEDLMVYLKSRSGNFDKLDHEILIALTFRKVLEREYGYDDYLIHFPPKQSAEKELNGLVGSHVKREEIGDFIRSYVEENTDVDVAYIQPEEKNPAGVMPYQVKRLGMSGKKSFTSKNLLESLEKFKLYAETQTGLLIYLEKYPGFNLEVILDFFRSNSLPFREVIIFFIKKDHTIDFIQLEPHEGDKYGVSSFSRDEIINI